MKRKITTLFLYLLLAVSLLTIFQQRVEAASETKGEIKILSVTPNNNLTPNEKMTFEVKVNYSFDGIDQAMIYVGFNNKSVDSYLLHDKKIVSQKSGQYTFYVDAEVKDWGNEGDFKAYVNISEYPHPNDWKPIASDTFDFGVSKDTTNANTFDGITRDTKTISNSKKAWTIKFTKEFNEASITSDKIYITDADGNKVSTTFEISDDKKAVTITPKAEFSGYEAGKIYYLYILNGTKSKENKSLKKSIKMPFIYESSENEILSPDPTCLEVNYLPGQDSYGNDYWLVTSKEMTLPKNYTLYVYYGSEDSADKINSSEQGSTATWNENSNDRVIKQGEKLAAPRAESGQYIYYRFVQGTSFNGESVSKNPNIPEGTPMSKWIADGNITSN